MLLSAATISRCRVSRTHACRLQFEKGVLSCSCRAFRLIELPENVSVGDMARIALALLGAKAIYTPGPTAVSNARVGQPEEADAPAMPEPAVNYIPEFSLDADEQCGSEKNDAMKRCIACQARYGLAVYTDQDGLGTKTQLQGGASAAGHRTETESVFVDRHSTKGAQSRSSGESSLSADDLRARTVDYEKAQRARITCCLSAVNRLRMGQGIFSKSLTQAHFQVSDYRLLTDFAVPGPGVCIR